MNNEARELASDMMLAAALANWGYAGESMIAVAVNKCFVPREEYAQHPLAEGDEIDVVEPISGG